MVKRKSKRKGYKKSYALFSMGVKAKDKYNVTTPPKSFFRTRKQAKQFIKKHKMKDYVKVLVY